MSPSALSSHLSSIPYIYLTKIRIWSMCVIFYFGNCRRICLTPRPGFLASVGRIETCHSTQCHKILEFGGYFASFMEIKFAITGKMFKSNSSFFIILSHGISSMNALEWKTKLQPARTLTYRCVIRTVVRESFCST